jgi:hypothetical protein
MILLLADIDQIDDSSWQTVSVPHDKASWSFDMTIDLQAVQVMEDGDKRRIKNGRTGPTLF